MKLSQLVTLCIAAGVFWLIAGCNGPAPGLNPVVTLKVNELTNWSSFSAGDTLSISAAVSPAAGDSVTDVQWSQTPDTAGGTFRSSGLDNVWQAPTSVTTATPITLTVTVKTLLRGRTSASAKVTILPSQQSTRTLPIQILVDGQQSWGSVGLNAQVQLRAEPQTTTDDPVVSTTWTTDAGTLNDTSTKQTASNMLVTPATIDKMTTAHVTVTMRTRSGIIGTQTVSIVISPTPMAMPNIQLSINGLDSWSNFTPGQVLRVVATVSSTSGDAPSAGVWSVDRGQLLSSNQLDCNWLLPTNYTGIATVTVNLTMKSQVTATARASVMIPQSAGLSVRWQIDGADRWNSFELGGGAMLNVAALINSDPNDPVASITWVNDPLLPTSKFLMTAPLTSTNVWQAPATLTSATQVKLSVTVVTRNNNRATADANFTLVPKILTVNPTLNGLSSWNTFEQSQAINFDAGVVANPDDPVVSTVWEKTLGEYLIDTNPSLKNTWRVTTPLAAATPVTLKVTVRTKEGAVGVATATFTVKPKALAISMTINGKDTWHTFEQSQSLAFQAAVTPAAGDEIKTTTWSAVNTATGASFGTFSTNSGKDLTNNLKIPAIPAGTEVRVRVTFTTATKLGQQGAFNAEFTVTNLGELDPVITLQVNNSSSWSNVQAGTTVALTATAARTSDTNPIISARWTASPAMAGSKFLITSDNSMTNAWLTPSTIVVPTSVDLTLTVLTLLGGHATTTVHLTIVPQTSLPKYNFGVMAWGMTNPTAGVPVAHLTGTVSGGYRLQIVGSSSVAGSIYQWTEVPSNISYTFDHPSDATPIWTAPALAVDATTGKKIDETHYLQVTVTTPTGLTSVNYLTVKVSDENP